LKEISARAKQAVTFKHIMRKREAIVELNNKLLGLAYINPDLQVIADGLSETFAQLPVVPPDKDSTEFAVSDMAATGVLALLVDSNRIAELSAKGENPFPINGIGMSGFPQLGGAISTTTQITQTEDDKAQEDNMSDMPAVSTVSSSTWDAATAATW
ncbi:MAG: hypothetical protein GY792_35185, partial [Gammaproteobacteria bacterium]|nr:hypothetical protein [Gammaproteobacteria bacterium]